MCFCKLILSFFKSENVLYQFLEVPKPFIIVNTVLYKDSLDNMTAVWVILNVFFYIYQGLQG